MHWHIEKVKPKDRPRNKVRVPGDVGPCCEGFATYADLFGTPDSMTQSPREDS